MFFASEAFPETSVFFFLTFFKIAQFCSQFIKTDIIFTNFIFKEKRRRKV